LKNKKKKKMINTAEFCQTGCSNIGANQKTANIIIMEDTQKLDSRVTILGDKTHFFILLLAVSIERCDVDGGRKGNVCLNKKK